MIKWKSRYEYPPKKNEECIVVDRCYSNLYFDVAHEYDDGEIRFHDRGDEFYIYQNDIITLSEFLCLKSKAKDSSLKNMDSTCVLIGSIDFK